MEVKMVGNPDEGNRDVTLTSMGGDIKLSVPSGLSMDIDIEIAFTKNYERNVDIISDFDIQKKVGDKLDKSNGSKWKYLTGKGSVNGGRNKIKIKTVNGNVYLERN